MSKLSAHKLFLVTGIIAVCLSYLPLPGLLMPSVAQAAELPMNMDFTQNVHGDIAAIGNINLTCPAADSDCAAAQSSDPLNPAAKSRNNEWNTSAEPVNIDPSAGFTDSSSAQLAIPAGSTVLKANLYWGGYNDSDVVTTNPQVPIQFRTPASSSYTQVESQQIASNNGSDVYWRAKADVTSLVSTGGPGNYYLADLTQYIDTVDGQGMMAFWTLIVAFSHPDQPLRNLTIFDGFVNVIAGGSGSTVYTGIEGFQTPQTGSFESKVGFAILDGDRGWTDKGIGIAAKNGSCDATSDWKNFADNAMNPPDDFYNSSISYLGTNTSYGGGTRNPSYSNNFAVDIDTFSTQELDNNATGACFKFATDGEGVMPFAIFSAIEIWPPLIDVTNAKTFANITHPNFTDKAVAGDTIEYSITAKSIGQDGVTDFILTDSLPTGVTYLPNSLKITAGPNSGSKTDASGDDQAFYDSNTNKVTFYLGKNANSSTGGQFDPAGGQDTQSTIAFRAVVNQDIASANIENTAHVSYIGATETNHYNQDTNKLTTAIIAQNVCAISVGSVALTSDTDYTIADHQPTFSGTAQPNSAVGITISGASTMQMSTQADANGHWSVKPTSKLNNGDHQVVISADGEAVTCDKSTPNTFTLALITGLPETGVSTIIGLFLMGIVYLSGRILLRRYYPQTIK